MAKNRGIIAVDIDDVVADTTEALRVVANKIDGVDLSSQDYLVDGEYWGYYERVWANHRVDHLVSFNLLHDDMAVDQNHVQIIPGAKEAITKLHETFKVVAVTSRSVEWIEKTKGWVNNNFPGVFEDIIFVHHDENDGRTKGDACLDVGAQWLIDDNFEHCQSALEKGVTALLFGDYGWNRRYHGDKSIKHVKNWQEVLEYFDAQG